MPGKLSHKESELLFNLWTLSHRIVKVVLEQSTKQRQNKFKTKKLDPKQPWKQYIYRLCHYTYGLQITMGLPLGQSHHKSKIA
jgi:hypothetical protein